MSKYLPNQIEPKWQKKWKEDKLFSPNLDEAKKPYYSLMMFPYPSAEGMHVGNMYAFTGADVFSRFKRLQGLDVFEPIGLDGFGIHGENYALKINEHPMEVSKRTEKHFYEQFMAIGNAYDWQRTLDTYKPNYYKWTQWAFLQLYKKGLAYRKKAEVNWCPSCLTVLADEQVISGECERCSSQVAKKELEQWFFKITDYAERLLNNLDNLDWTDKVKIAQKNWIGKSDGVLLKFKIEDSGSEIEVFTTALDTIFGVTFMAVSPEHPIVSSLKEADLPEVKDYIKKARHKPEMARLAVEKDKTGVFSGSYCVNPLNGEKVPVWIADYVLMNYGTGAVMGVPGHDARDHEFAKKYHLPIKPVIKPTEEFKDAHIEPDGFWDYQEIKTKFTEGSELVNSGKFDEIASSQAKKALEEHIEKEKIGKKDVQYHLRDWLISRQRYWGPPIPIIYCDKCGVVPVKEEDLPIELPYIKDFKPTGTGVSPLASDSDFVNTICPKCDGPAKRETDVSDNFFDSALYFFRYLTTEFDDKFFDPERTEKWLPVDMYIGGAEHSVLHLLYSRFVTMVFKDLGLIDFEEPFTKFRAHGLLIRDGAKISKSKGNAINPGEFINGYGADAFRTYLMFMGPFTEGGDFRDVALGGSYRFLNRIWDLAQNYQEKEATEAELKSLHKTIKKAGTDMENLHYNTAISSLMELLNFLSRQKTASKETIKAMLIMLAPFAPHITEELWEKMGEKYSIHQQSWPKFDQKYLEEDEITIAIQVNGKLRETIMIQKDMVNRVKDIEKRVASLPKVQRYIGGQSIRKTIYVPGKILNLVI